MEKNPDEIPMFAVFVERRLGLPSSDFFRGFLNFFKIEYVNLNPNSIFQLSCYVHFCEAFLGIQPHWELFRKLFQVKAHPYSDQPEVVGGAGLQLGQEAKELYFNYKLVDSCGD